MSRPDRTLDRILRGGADANIDFSDLRACLKALGFAERIKGDHHIYTRSGVEDIINLQPLGSKAKVYQVKQVRQIIVRYSLGARE